MMKNLKNNRLVVVVVIATVFGIASGFVGEMLARVYMLEDTFNIPFFSEIDLRGGNTRTPGLVIRNPKKVVVEQNEKVGEIVESATESIVGVYKKKISLEDIEVNEGEKVFDIEEYYKLNDRLGEAFIVTSDGWLISNYTPRVTLSSVSTTTGEISQKIVDEYVVIDGDNDVYNVLNMVVNEESDYSFWKIDSRDLSARELVTSGEIKNGQILVGIDIDGRVVIETVGDVVNSNLDMVKFTDEYNQKISLLNEIEEGYFFFNLGGGFVGFSESGKNIELINNHFYAIDSLLLKRKISKPNFGIYYVDLSELVTIDENEKMIGAMIYRNKKGVAIVEDSIADRAKLLPGDVVVSINNIEINKENNLASVLSTFKIGDSLSIGLLRSGDDVKIEIEIE